jgi:hypothetical protein
MTPSRRLMTTAAALLGTALFIYAIQRAGTAEILDGIRRVGWGLLLILAIGGARFLLRAQCWRLCVRRGMSDRRPLTFGHAFVAFVAGDAVGTVTPLGLLASEPTKVLLTRHHLATRESVSSLALENLVYAASVVAMIAAGIVVLLATVPLSAAWRQGLVGALAIAAAGGAASVALLRSGLGGVLPRSGWRGKLSAIRQELRDVAPGVLLRVFALDIAYHALAVLEVFVTLEWLLGDRSPTIAQAVVFEALNRVVTVVFKFVPFRVGIDEALTGALAPVLTLNAAAGVTLAVVRKVRNLVWAGVGLVFVATHPARSR